MLIFCLFLGGTAAAKRPVRDFCTMYFSDRTNWYMGVRADFKYVIRTDYGVYVRERWSRIPRIYRRSTMNKRKAYAAVCRMMDSMELIDYRSDTVYVLSLYQFGFYPHFRMIRTKKDTVRVTQDTAISGKVFRTQTYYHPSFLKYRIPFVLSDSLLFATTLSWKDKDEIVRLNERNTVISKTGENGQKPPFETLEEREFQESSEYYSYDAERFILKDYRIVRYDNVTFDDVGWWCD